ncbi:MAG: DUF6111 family protein [Hyphomicrobiaceae bacterium]
MMRLFVTCGLLFLLPFLLFAIYATVMDYLAMAKPGEQVASAWQNPPLGPLTFAGSFLVLATLIYLGVTSGSGHGTTGTYHPPTINDGKVQPGYVE